MVIFHSYVSLPEGTVLASLPFSLLLFFSECYHVFSSLLLRLIMSNITICIVITVCHYSITIGIAFAIPININIYNTSNVLQ